MAKKRLDHTALAASSGEPSGLYLYTDGVAMFTPLDADIVLRLITAEMKSGMTFLRTELPSIAPLPGAPSPGEGTHGAGSDNTTDRS